MSDGTGRPTAYQEMARSMRGGSGLAGAMARQPESFTPAEVAVVAASERSPAMAEILDSLEGTTGRLVTLVRTLHLSMIYGGLMALGVAKFGGSAAQSIGLMGSFAEVIEPAHAAGRAIAILAVPLNGVVMAVQAAVGLGALLLAGCLLSSRLRARVTGRLIRLLGRLPWIGWALVRDCTGQFLRVLAALLESGIPVPAAVATASASLSALGLDDRAREAARRTAAGTRLSEALGGTGLLDTSDAWRLEMAEDTGAVPDRLRVLGRDLERAADDRLQRFRRFLEPAMTVAFGLLVGVLAASLSLTLQAAGDATALELMR